MVMELFLQHFSQWTLKDQSVQPDERFAYIHSALFVRPFFFFFLLDLMTGRKWQREKQNKWREREKKKPKEEVQRDLGEKKENLFVVLFNT